MSLVSDSAIIVIGGMSSTSLYSEPVYMLDIYADEVVWTALGNTTGARPIGE